MDIGEERGSGVLVLAPVGRLDANTSAELERRLLEQLSAGETLLVVDMAGVEYISSAGLRVLLMVAKKLKERSGQIALCALGPAVRQVFELAGLLALFPVEPSRENAMARLARGT